MIKDPNDINDDEIRIIEQDNTSSESDGNQDKDSGNHDKKSASVKKYGSPLPCSSPSSWYCSQS